MAWFAGFGGRIILQNPSGSSLQVSITDPSGAASTIYSDAARTTALTQPLTQTATSATYYVANNGTYTLSVLQNGREVANTPDGTLTVRLTADNAIEVAPAADIANGGMTDLSNQYASAFAPASSSTVRLRRKMNQNLSDVNIVVLGDSTGVFQSAADPRWVYMLAQKLGAAFPAYTVKYQEWVDGTSLWGTATTLRVGTGSRTLNMWNGSVSGMRPSYHLAPNLTAIVVTPNPDLVIFSHGKNEGVLTANNNTINSNGARYLAMTETVRKVAPYASSLVVCQCPSTANNDMQARAVEYAFVSQLVGLGVVDVCQAFLANPTWATDWMNVDGIHPNTAGSIVWVNEVWKAFTGALTDDPRPITASSLTQAGQIVAAYNFENFVAGSPPPGWTDTNSNITWAKQSSLYESRKAFSLDMTANTAAVSKISRTEMNGTSTAKFLGGQWVTFAARVQRAGNQPSSAAQVSINDSVSFVQSQGNPQNKDGFYWEIATMQVSTASTFLTVQIFCDGSANNGSRIYVDRAVLIVGRLPADIATMLADPGGQTFVGPVTSTTVTTGRGVTGSRPSAAAVGAGAQWFDTTLVKPIWSDGVSAWKDATGATV